MAESNLDNLKNILKSAIKIGNKREIVSILKNILDSESLSNEDFYDLIGFLLIENPEYFMNKFYKFFLKKILWRFNSAKLGEMEEYILKKYSFFEGEELLTSFKGRIIQKDTQVTGRVYLTNYRVIAHGKFGPTTMSSIGAAGAGMAGGGSGTQGSTMAGASMAVNSTIQQYLQKKLQGIMKQNSQTNKSCYGYQYPIMNAFYIVRKKKSFNYRVNLEYKKGNRTKTAKLKLKIIPKQELGELKLDFNNKRKEVLDLVEQKVNQYN